MCRIWTNLRLAPVFLTLFVACSSSTESAPGSSGEGAANPGSTGSSIPGDAGFIPDGHIDAKTEGGTGSAVDGGVPLVGLRTGVEVPSAMNVHAVITTASGVYFASTTEVRKIDDPKLGSSHAVATLPPPKSVSDGITLTATSTNLYFARRSATTSGGELYVLPLAGGTAQLVGRIPASTPNGDDEYPITATLDGSDVLVAANPNVWHLPATGDSLSKLPTGANNFYVSALAVGTLGFAYSFAGGQQDYALRFPLQGGPTSLAPSGKFYGAPETFLAAGGYLFGTDDFPNSPLTRQAMDFASAPTVFLQEHPKGIGTDGSLLYAAVFKEGGLNSNDFSEMVVANVSSGAEQARFTVRRTSDTRDLILKAPMAVDASYIYTGWVGNTLLAIPR